MSTQFEDFYLIVNSVGVGRYTVEAQGPGQISKEPLPFVYHETYELAEALEEILEGYSPSREHVTGIGRLLFGALFPPPILEAFGRAYSTLPKGVALRLRLNIRPPELARLPWELLYHPHEEIFLATRRSYPLVRFLDSSAQPVAPLVVEGVLKVLVVQSQPSDFVSLNLAQSLEALEEALGHRAEVTVLSNATPAALRDRLRGESFHVLHYDGHGLFDDASADETGFLVLEDSEGKANPLSSHELANYLDGTTVRLVVLAACETARDGSGQRFVGVAQHLMRTSNLPATVAMQFSIPDASAIAFIRGFYDALADGYPVDVALADGRMAILEVTSKTEPDWATPVLFMRTSDGRLWERLPISRAPYMGLNTFTEEDADFFFGRESLVQSLVQRLDASHEPFLAVLGPSGSGKSSVVRAGLLPALKDEALVGSSRWHYLTIKPTARPLHSLAARLHKLQGGTLEALDAVHKLREVLAKDAQALLLAAEMMRTDNPETRLVLVVDQFEELWTLRRDAQALMAQEQQRFIDLLLAAAQQEGDSPALVVILTMRADFLHHAAAFSNRDLARAIEKHLVIVSPMEPDELQEAIEKPARLAGGRFEPGLVNKLIEQVSGRPGALPLLEYTLLELWKAKQSDGTMTWEAYRTIGGVEGALAARADAILEHEYTSSQQNDLRHLLLRLVQPGEGTIDTRRRAQLDDLVLKGMDVTNVQLLLKPLVDERLLTTDQDPTSKEETVEISHEALIRAWPTFAQWVEEAREDLRFQLQLEDAAKEWAANDEKPDYLWGGLRLANAEAWLERVQPLLNERDERFLGASRVQEQKRKEAAETVRRDRERLLEKARDEAQRRAAAEQRNASRLRIFLFVALILIGFVAVFARSQNLARADAEKQARITQSQANAFQALSKLSNNQEDEALLLALTSLLDRPQDLPHLTLQAVRQVVNETLIDHILQGHSTNVVSMAVREDGQYVLMGSDDGTASLWDIQKRQAVHSLSKHNGPVLSVAFSLDGQYALTGSSDKTARLWDVKSREQLHELSGHNEDVISLAFSPNGLNVLTGSKDNTARLWNRESGQFLHQFEGHSEDVVSLAFSPDEKYIVTGSRDNTARLWDVKSYQLVDSLEQHSEDVVSAAVSSDGQYVLMGGLDNTPHLWNVQSGQLVYPLEGHSEDVVSLTFSQDGQYVLTGSNDRTARLWDIHSRSSIHTLSPHSREVISVAFDAKGQYLLTGSLDKKARLWDRQKGELVHTLEGHTDRVVSVAFTTDKQDKKQYMLTGSKDGEARLWSIENNKLVSNELPKPLSDVVSMAASSDGQLLVMGSLDNTAQLWEIQNDDPMRESMRELSGHSGWIVSVTFSQDGQYLLTGSWDDTARIWNVHNSQLLHELSGHSEDVVSLAFSPDGQHVLTGSADNTARLWNRESGELLHQLSGHSGDVVSVAFSPDGQHLLTASLDNTVRVWNVQSGELFHLLKKRNSDGVQSVAFSPDGQRLLTGGWDGTVRLWDVQSPESFGLFLGQFLGHSDDVVSLTVSEDGQYGLTGSRDGTARLWDMKNNQLLHEFLGHGEEIVSVAFSQEGKFVLTGSRDGMVRIWLVDERMMRAALTEHVCDVFTEEEISNEMPEWREWRGCPAELNTLEDDLAEYKQWLGQEW